MWEVDFHMLHLIAYEIEINYLGLVLSSFMTSHFDSSKDVVNIFLP